MFALTARRGGMMEFELIAHGPLALLAMLIGEPPRQ
jgi:hypothetical protein